MGRSGSGRLKQGREEFRRRCGRIARELGLLPVPEGVDPHGPGAIGEEVEGLPGAGLAGVTLQPLYAGQRERAGGGERRKGRGGLGPGAAGEQAAKREGSGGEGVSSGQHRGDLLSGGGAGAARMTAPPVGC
ncbi:MAG: hypothetical protein M3R02_13820 [Chloroflexota bacterium]|nr:hypothetical protein [Chloroflexota bacterium]